MAVEVGIDLGTTNTVVQMKSKDGICNIPVDNEPLLPSVFYKNKKKTLFKFFEVIRGVKMDQAAYGVQLSLI